MLEIDTPQVFLGSGCPARDLPRAPALRRFAGTFIRSSPAPIVARGTGAPSTPPIDADGTNPFLRRVGGV